MVKLKHINTTLVTVIILTNCYTLFLPFYPRALFWWQQRVEHKTEQTNRALQSLSKTATKPTNNTIPDTETLIIPSIGMQSTVFEGRTVVTANQGLWHRPQTSSPDLGSNTVIVGHRFSYKNPRGIFYELDKVALDDQIALIWHKQVYIYRVTEIKIVPPSDTSVEAATTDARLTLYTCTPLLTAKNRLVVTAIRTQP